MASRFYRPAVAVLAFVLMVVMVLSAIGIGAYRSFAQARENVASDRDQLIQLVTARHGAANNILTVAERHLPADDPDVAALRTALAYSRGNLPMDRLWALDDTIGRSADAVLAALRTLGSVQTDERDRMYIDQMLPKAMDETARMLTDAPYNRSAGAFNERLNTQFSGRVAQLIGIKPFPLFQREGGL